MLPTVSMLGTVPLQCRCKTRPRLAGWPPLRLQKAAHRTDVLSLAAGRLAASLRLGSYTGIGRALGSVHQSAWDGCRRRLDVHDGETSHRELICLSWRLRGTRSKQRAEQASSSGRREIRSHLPLMTSPVAGDTQRLGPASVHKQEQG